MADADGKPRLGCLVKPCSIPCRDFADTGWHGLARRLRRHSHKQSAQAPFTADNTPIRSRPEGLESQCRKEFLGNPGSIDSKRETQSLLTPLIAPERQPHRQVRRMAREPSVAPIDSQAGIERHSKRSEQALHPLARDQVEQRAAHNGVNPVEGQATRHLCKIDGQSIDAPSTV